MTPHLQNTVKVVVNYEHYRISDVYILIYFCFCNCLYSF